MTKPGFSVRILLHDGEVSGVRFLEVANWTGLAILTPRDRYIELRGEQEFNRTGVYILAGPDPQAEGSTRVYVGRADELRKRLDKHAVDRNWWDTCLCFTTSDDSLTLTQIQYLEAALISRAKRAGQVNLDNVQIPEIPKLGRADLLDLARFFDNVLMIAGMAGFDFFEIADHSAKQPEAQIVNDEQFRFHGIRFKYVGAGGYSATGRYEALKRFVINRGSVARREETNSCPEKVRAIRKKLKDTNILEESGNGLVFQEDHEFNSPSLAASVIYGGSSNGRTAWADQQNNTISDLDNLDLSAQEALETLSSNQPDTLARLSDERPDTIPELPNQSI